MVESNKPIIIDQIASYSRNREAIPSFTGYLFQFELALLHILEDGSIDDAFDNERIENKGSFFIEKIEDYLKYYCIDNIKHLKLAQIKYHSGYAGAAEYEEAVLWLYYNFLLFNKHNTNSDEKIHFTVFHHDKSPDNKSPINIFSEGLNKNAVKSTDKQDKVYKKILDEENGLNSTNLRKEFIKVLSFKKTKDRVEIIEKIQNLLVRNYSSYRSEYSEKEFMYGAALSFLMDKGIKGDWITQSKLDNYFINTRVNVNKEYYLFKIFTLLEEIIELILKGIKTPIIPVFRSVSELTQNEIYIYETILHKIEKFLISKLRIEKNRRTLLNTIISNSFKVDYHCNSNDEFELFLGNKDSLQAYIMKLAKIMFFHHKENKGIIILNKWIKITSEIWLFTYPDEKRINGAILGRTSIDGMSTLGDLIQRFVNYENKPGIWYMKIGEEDNHIRASQTFYYQHDITQINTEPTPCYPDDIFHIQCLNCLGINKYTKTELVQNVFTNGCVRGDS
ncbi:hypothetical protein [Fictibacillus sp. 26RED30]|uniref:hypothetical protein n=1 Tax=Fictibacillus sp. 26RED30 TaxID=2745877 RepID=UPI0018CD8137|nr:hypothetical protein [Fictibacillus sp. 26RED30]MBH0160459.1 hypothetical protein [Fictibacillus sp. 26RED30]